MHEHLSEFGIIDMGGATAYIGGEIGGAISRVAGDWLSGIASPVLRNALPNMIGGGVSGFAVGAGFSLFGGASFKEAMSEGGKGAAFGAALGAISGTVKGIRYGRENGVNPWTGEFSPEAFSKMVQQKVPCPEGWVEVPSNKNGGVKYVDPNNPKGNNIRVMPGNPKGNPAQKVPYVKYYMNGRFYDVNGFEIFTTDPKGAAGTPQSHIPLRCFDINVMIKP